MTAFLMGSIVLLAGILLLFAATLWLVTSNPGLFVLFKKLSVKSRNVERLVSSRSRMAVTVLAVAAVASLVLFGLVIVSYSFNPMQFFVFLSFAAATFFFAQLIGTTRTRAIVTIGCAGALLVLWWMWPNWLTSNMLAVLLAIGTIVTFLALTRQFKVIVLCVGGFFVYDVINVFLTGAIVELVENTASQPLPYLFGVPQSLALDSPLISRLGTGDVALPGVLIIVAGLFARTHQRMSVFYFALAGYALGVMVAVTALLTFESAQPALLYLFPCVMAGILFAAWRADLLRELGAFKEYDASLERGAS